MQNDTQKISTKIWRPVIDKLTRKMDEACLRRDSYLNKVLEKELAYLDTEVNVPNSEEAQTFIAKELDKLDRKIVSLALRPDLIERLNDICARKRIVRDAFFNRVFLLLTAPPKWIDIVIFDDDPNWRVEVWSEDKNNSSAFQNLFYPLEQDIDPFWAIRGGIELNNELVDSHALQIDSFYAQILGGELIGINCHIPDAMIPGHPDQVVSQKELDELLMPIFPRSES